MGKIKQQFMDLNRETAMRLWGKFFGKDAKATDFAGRIMAKGAYNDRNSEFGWNVDHILPQSKGGATADHNLICCHIKTNDEKADKFPCFNANGRAFEIIKVQNHYEIRPKDNGAEAQTEAEKVQFYDSASGVRFFKHLKGVQNKGRLVGTIFIKLYGLKNTAVVDFIENLMGSEHLSYKAENSSLYRHCCSDIITIVAHNYNMPLKGDIAELLDKCILLNTYLSHYFMPCEYIGCFDIYYRCDWCKDRLSMYDQLGKINYKYRDYSGDNSYIRLHSGIQNSLFVNDLVLENTNAGEKITQRSGSEYTVYNYVFTKLAENLEKEADGK